MEVQLGNVMVPLEIVKKNNKNIYFKFKEDGTLYVTCGRFVTQKEIYRIIKQEENSLLKMYEKFSNRQAIDSQFYYLGEPYVIVFDDKINHVQIDNNCIIARDENMLDKWYKNECIKIFSERIEAQINQFFNIPPFRLRIRKMKTRWGVNNVTKCIITLNSELLKKDVTLIDYVIVHELCHFYEANHSSRFWAQVEKRYPYYKLARKRLKVE